MANRKKKNNSAAPVIRRALFVISMAVTPLSVTFTSGCTDCDCYDEICFDGVDNDADGLVDCNDDDCDAFCSFGNPGGPLVTPEVDCSDGIDNDGDGLIDCADPNCMVVPPCSGSSTFGEICNNGIDDNANGAIDCNDYLCIFDSGCRNLFCPALSEESCLTPGDPFAYSSLAMFPRRGETLRLAASAPLFGVTFWGVQTGPNPPQFVVTYHAGAPALTTPHTLPSSMLASFSQTAMTLTIVETTYSPSTSLIVNDDGTASGPSFPLIRYDATHAPISLQANNCYVVVIHDEANQFAWAGAMPFDGTTSFRANESSAWQIAPGGQSFDLTLCPILGAGQGRGACCYSNLGMCYDDIAAQDCASSGRTYHGDGSICQTSPPCNQAVGACCFGDGICVISTQGGCDGTYRGDGTTCPPNPPCP